MLFLWLFILRAHSGLGVEDFEVELEPGHTKHDYDSVEEVKGHINETTTEKFIQDELLLKEAILDVAYYLRRFKFKGHDPRFMTGGTPEATFFARFPTPPLRNIQWEIKKNCESSFVECVKYIQETVSQTVLPRHLDSSTITKQNGWSFLNDKDLIKSADAECLELLERDENAFDVFSSPLEKFQWLTSASYYMCLYTMKEITHLRVFAEGCADFASCISWDVGLDNQDIRADNAKPFACSLYSFCPDPCCPLEYVRDSSLCLEASPCSQGLSADRNCLLIKRNNVHMESLVLNHWNVSCRCDQAGMRWDSRSGMCVDVDECLELESACSNPSETCRNLPGNYKCVCSPLGYTTNFKTNACELDPLVQNIINPPKPVPQNQSGSFAERFTGVINKVRDSISPRQSAFNRSHA